MKISDVLRHPLSVLAAVMLLLGASPTSGSAQTMQVTLAPGDVDVARGLARMDVELKVSAMEAQAGQAVLTLPVVIANTDTIATTLTDLTITDALGPVPWTVRDDPVAMVYARHWIAGRAVSGDVTVRYRAPIDNTPPRRGSGPPYSLRTEGGGVSGVGNTFILLPEDDRDYRIALRWDLTGLDAGANATSSYGEGDVDLEAGKADRLSSTVFMAGPMQREPMPVSNTGFSAAWLGETPFEAQPLMAWTHQLHGWMSRFFAEPGEPPYRVFMRYNPINAGGGVALTRSFLVTYGQATDPADLKSTLSHEMIHTWTQWDGRGQWYGEGIAVYYQGLLPYRAGLITADDYLADINDTARRYYSNLLNDTPDDQIAPRFWEDSRIRVLPYDRGGLYFAVVNGKVRRASQGARSLDDLILEMNRRRRAGETVNEAVWVALLTAELGEDGQALHVAMKAGELMLPEADDYGPCFTRYVGRARRFDLGFDPKSLVGDVKTIRGLVPGSAAEQAGIRNGDVVTYAVAMDGVQSNPQAMLTLQVTRGEDRFPVTYLPRGEEVDVYQWRRAPDAADAACKT
jgi:predicted metalloprotease with PDZ domain